MSSVHPVQAQPDDGWACGHLTPEEYRVYLNMDPRDREHGTRVAKRLLRNHPNVSPHVIAAAILHDCGKSIRRFSLLERVFLGLIPETLSAKCLPGWTEIRRTHPDLGRNIVRSAGGREVVADLIARHHHPKDDPDANLLYRYDHSE
ncbi:MAG: HD domain-containing protein [Deinococcaceae bacterium]